MTPDPAHCPIRLFCCDANRLTTEHAEVWRRDRPPRVRGWREDEANRHRLLGEFKRLSAPARVHACKSNLPATEIEHRIDELMRAVCSFLSQPPGRCCSGLGNLLDDTGQDGPDIEADPSHWNHEEAVRWRQLDDLELGSMLGVIRQAIENCEQMADLADGYVPLKPETLFTFDTLGNGSTEPPELTHAPDFAWMRCPAGAFTFTQSQRPVVRELLADWNRHGLGLSERYLLDKAGKDDSNLRDIFKDSPAWNVLIGKGAQKDTFRLMPLKNSTSRQRPA